MYIANSNIDIIWVFATTIKSVDINTLDVMLVTASGASSYITAPLTAFIAPGLANTGTGTFTFTPTQHGEYTIKLVTGGSTSYQIVDEFNLTVRGSIPTTSIHHDVRVLATETRDTWIPGQIATTTNLLVDGTYALYITGGMRIMPELDLVVRGTIDNGNGNGRVYTHQLSAMTNVGTDRRSEILAAGGNPYLTFQWIDYNPTTGTILINCGEYQCYRSTDLCASFTYIDDFRVISGNYAEWPKPTPYVSGINSWFAFQSYGGQRIWMSADDGITWAYWWPTDLPTSHSVANLFPSGSRKRCFTWQGNSYIFGSKFGKYIWTSNTGSAGTTGWNAEQIDVSNTYLTGSGKIAHGPNEIITIQGKNSMGVDNNTCYRSTNGVDWTEYTPAAFVGVVLDEYHFQYSYVFSAYILRDSTTNLTYQSTDGIDWTVMVDPFDAVGLTISDFPNKVWGGDSTIDIEGKPDSEYLAVTGAYGYGQWIIGTHGIVAQT